MFDKEQEFDGCVYSQKEVIVALKEHFGAETTERLFLDVYHSYHGPETRSKPCGIVNAEVARQFTNAQRITELPYYVMRTYQLLVSSS